VEIVAVGPLWSRSNVARIEEPDLLQFAVFIEFEVVRLEAKDQLIVLVAHNKVNHEESRLRLKLGFERKMVTLSAMSRLESLYPNLVNVLNWSRYSLGLFQKILPVRRSLRQSPNVGRFIEFNPIMARTVIAGEDDSPGRGSAGAVYMDSHWIA
jgi:hypothetical protein